MLGQILSILADQDINVVDMLNKSRGEVAYNLIDLESPPQNRRSQRSQQLMMSSR